LGREGVKCGKDYSIQTTLKSARFWREFLEHTVEKIKISGQGQGELKVTDWKNRPGKR